MVAACPFPVNYGSPGAIRELAQTLSEMGHNVHIVTYPEGDDLPIGNARLHRAGKVARSKGPQAGPSLRKLWIDLLLVIKLCRVIWSEKVEIIHAHNYEGGVAGVIRGLHEMATKHGLSGTRKKTITEVCGYLKNNQGRMRYHEYLAAGYPIASGVIEGACRHLVKDRMERAGMHWTPAGAQAMLDVRSVFINGDWDQYQAYRIDCETQTLYPHRHLVHGPQYAQAC